MPGPRKIKDVISIASRNSERLNLLINDLLDMEKLVAGKMTYDMKTYAVANLVEQALVENKMFADKYSVKYKLISLDNCLVVVDGLRFQQILSNLLSNAAKFSPKNSSVDIDIKQKDEQVIISVRDYGKGIAPEFHHNMFKKFSQVSGNSLQRREGTGLGLVISKGLVEAMHGTIGFSSELGAGSCFFVTFPIAPKN